MTDVSAIRVFNFSGNKDDWFTWSEKFLAEAKPLIKDILLGRFKIPKTLDPVDEKTEEGNRQLKAIDLNELAFIELVLLKDVSSFAGKIAFSIIKSCKSKEYEDGNSALAWEK
jgi:hypothetical protein